MAEFAYTALAQDGRQIKGTISAPSREMAISSLHGQNVRLLNVKEATGSKKRGGFGNKVKLKDLVIFTRELSTMIDAGVPLPRGLSTLSAQTENKYFKEVLTSLTRDIESGQSLADAMAKFPKVFSDVYVNMVRAGEAGGILDEILKRLATQVEKDASIHHKIHSAMAYPMVILTVTIVAFFGIMLVIMPKIGKIIKDLGGPNAQLPVYTRAMLGISTFIQHNIIPIVIISVISVWLFKRYISTDRGKFWWHGRLLKLPVFGTVLGKIAVARFSRTFASLMSSGVTVLDALAVTGKAVGNKVIQAELEKVAANVKNGQSLGRQIADSKYFPPIVGQMILVGEETGKIDEILIKVADFYEEEVDAVIDGLASIIEPIMIIVLGSVVGLIAASVMGPIAGLSKQVGN